MYFGGKSRVAPLIWERLGDVDNYIEPFFGSGAVLLARPHPPRIETVNDLDCYVANFWRATSSDPESVAEHADSPVNESDLHARHRWLVLSEAAAEFRQRMRSDPDYFDPKFAGWWCWGLCCWIGGGWCSYATEQDRRPQLNDEFHTGGKGVHARGPSEKLPRLTGGRTGDEYYGGLGVHADKVEGLSQKKPSLSQWQGGCVPEATAEPHKKDGWPHGNHRPQLADAHSRGRGVHSNDSAGTCAQRRAWLIDWFGRLRDRLRTVRVCCGDWSRVCSSPSVTTRLGITAVFVDPPYAKTRTDGTANRSGDLYGNDRTQNVDQLARDVRDYCIKRGYDPKMRLALAGYEGEGHEELESHGWTVVAWKASGGYGNRSDTGKENATRERLWFSPHCLKPGEIEDMPLFGGGEESRSA